VSIDSIIAEANEADREILASVRAVHGDVLADQLHVFSHQTRVLAGMVAAVFTAQKPTPILRAMLIEQLADALAHTSTAIALGYPDDMRGDIRAFALTLANRSVELITKITRESRGA
jgi:hypothetical protein